MNKQHRAALFLSQMLAFTGKTMDNIIDEARASVALDGETQSGAECAVCRHLYNDILNRCPKCGEERKSE